MHLELQIARHSVLFRNCSSHSHWLFFNKETCIIHAKYTTNCKWLDPWYLENLRFFCLAYLYTILSLLTLFDSSLYITVVGMIFIHIARKAIIEDIRQHIYTTKQIFNLFLPCQSHIRYSGPSSEGVKPPELWKIKWVNTIWWLDEYLRE